MCQIATMKRTIKNLRPLSMTKNINWFNLEADSRVWLRAQTAEPN